MLVLHVLAHTAHSLYGVIKAGAMALYLFRKFITFMPLLVASFHNQTFFFVAGVLTFSPFFCWGTKPK